MQRQFQSMYFRLNNHRFPAILLRFSSSSSSYVQPDTPKSPNNRLVVPRTSTGPWQSRSTEHSPSILQYCLTNASNTTNVPSYSSGEGSPFLCLDSPATRSGSEGKKILLINKQMHVFMQFQKNRLLRWKTSS